MLQFYQILKNKNGRVIVELDEQLMEIIINDYSLHQQIKNETQQTQLDEQKFQRRIVPFFLNQFMHWAKQMDYKKVECYLKVIHNRKTSKQQKWELGDLQKIFGPINSRTRCIQIETQQRWKEFLDQQAEMTVIMNNKIKDQQTKRKYIDAIPQLKQELDKKNPYHRFLSISINPKIDYKISTETCIDEHNQKEFEFFIENSDQEQDRLFTSFIQDDQESI
ncbi:unnamed protein product [Paramecium primaurelia]|uniref:Uncharacterized protein n=1 Tax=Paramecium primaurelia TaxID=5886 RepID=A0A8S1P9H7_PARPR|nr:unnamed protein product [Paramecium primaurelia]